MVLEAAILNIRSGQAEESERAFAQAQIIVADTPGYISHELHRCIEVDHKYQPLVRWEQLENHTEHFRKSVEYQDWKRLLHHYYDPFPTVEHYECIG